MQLDMADHAHLRLASRLDEVSALLAGRLGATGKDLLTQAKQARRHLPWSVRRELGRLAAAQAQLGHPKGAGAVDYALSTERADFVITRLREIDPMRRHVSRILGTLAVIAANGLILLALSAWLAQSLG